MKRIGYLYKQIYSIENLYRADMIAARGQGKAIRCSDAHEAAG